MTSEQLQELDEKVKQLPEELVRCRGVYDLSSQSMKEIEVLLSYEDLAFILAIIENYIEELKEQSESDPLLDYYIVKYKCIAKTLKQLNI